MLAVETTSTTAKPSVTLPRKRRVGSLGDSDRGQTRFDNPTLNPRLLSENRQDREREPPDPMPKIRAEWIRGRKFAEGRRPIALSKCGQIILSVMVGLVPAIHVFLAETVKAWMPGTSPGMTS
jgi:hypothetical protein